MTENLFDKALDALLENKIDEKIKKVCLLNEQWRLGALNSSKTKRIKKVVEAGRPNKPCLVDPKQVEKRSFSTETGRLKLVHAITHIEFNAINLALDAVYRFQEMPKQFYSDWCRVAVEEVEHFQMLSHYLHMHNKNYGDYNAHNGLWEMAIKTDKDVMIRMALVPRVLEARGLDVTPLMIKKLKHENEKALALILQRIFTEEIGHVKIGSYWFNKLCQQRALDAEKTFFSLIKTYMHGAKFGRLDIQARLDSGFTKSELDGLMHYF